MATLGASTAGAVLAISCALVLSGCTAGPSTAGPETSGSAAPAEPLPTPTGTWTPAPTDAPPGPVTPAPLPTQKAPIDQPIEFGTGVVVSLTSVASTSVTAKTPGEISGTAVVVRLAVQNDSTEPVNLDSAVVNLSADGGAYGVGTTAGGPRPLAGTIAPGKKAEGSYVFMLDPARGRSVTVTVNYAAGEPVAIFTGKTS